MSESGYWEIRAALAAQISQRGQLKQHRPAIESVVLEVLDTFVHSRVGREEREPREINSARSGQLRLAHRWLSGHDLSAHDKAAASKTVEIIGSDALALLKAKQGRASAVRGASGSESRPDHAEQLPRTPAQIAADKARILSAPNPFAKPTNPDYRPPADRSSLPQKEGPCVNPLADARELVARLKEQGVKPSEIGRHLQMRAYFGGRSSVPVRTLRMVPENIEDVPEPVGAESAPCAGHEGRVR